MAETIVMEAIATTITEVTATGTTTINSEETGTATTGDTMMATNGREMEADKEEVSQAGVNKANKTNATTQSINITRTIKTSSSKPSITSRRAIWVSKRETHRGTLRERQGTHSSRHSSSP